MSSEIKEILSELRFFKVFSEDILARLSSFMEMVTFPSGFEILTQGQKNTKLFFLVDGRVGIYVDGGHVASMGQRGDVLGEMSVISQEPSSATIRSEGNCRLISVDALKFQELSGSDFDYLQLGLYRIYSFVLTEKLRKTNEKAKHFEELSRNLNDAKEKLEKTNEELEERVSERTQKLERTAQDLRDSNQVLEQKNSELVASHRKIEELYSSRDFTLGKLESLYKGHLLPLKKTLEEIQMRSDEDSVAAVLSAGKEVDSVLALLEPITSRYKSERALKFQEVLVADSSRKQQTIIKMALGGTGIKVESAFTPEEAMDKLQAGSYDIIFFSSEFFDFTVQARAQSPNAKFVYMTAEAIPNYLPTLRAHSFLPNIVSRDEEDRVFTIKSISTAVLKLGSGDIFGLEKYLNWGAEVKRLGVKSSRERAGLIELMCNYFEELGIRRPLRQRCGVVAEELLMNAIYDAPKDHTGKSLFNHLERTCDINLEPAQYGEMSFASDGVFMGLAVSDPFGGLDGKIILDYLDSCYGGRAGELNREKGGAGRGLHQIIENSDLVVFNVYPGYKTEVVALFNLDAKSQKNKYPSFHFFSSSPA